MVNLNYFYYFIIAITIITKALNVVVITIEYYNEKLINFKSVVIVIGLFCMKIHVLERILAYLYR